MKLFRLPRVSLVALIKFFRNLNSFHQLGEDADTVIPLTPTADEDANIFSKLFFCWVNPLIKKGYDGQLKTIDDLFPLPPSLKVDTIEQQFVEAAPSFYTDASPFSLPKSLFHAFGWQYLALGILRFTGDCLSFAGPILLHYLVTELEDGDQNVSYQRYRFYVSNFGSEKLLHQLIRCILFSPMVITLPL